MTTADHEAAAIDPRPTTGRAVGPRQARPRVRARVDYEGRGGLDAALDQLRRSLLQLARQAPADESAAQLLAEVVDAAVTEVSRLAAAADQALLRTASGQAEVRRQLAKAERMLRRPSNPRMRALAERELEHFRRLLVDQDLGGGR